MSPAVLGYALFVVLAGAAILWVGRQARIVKEQVQESNKNVD
jgi:hypothetical protein